MLTTQPRQNQRPIPSDRPPITAHRSRPANAHRLPNPGSSWRIHPAPASRCASSRPRPTRHLGRGLVRFASRSAGCSAVGSASVSTRRQFLGYLRVSATVARRAELQVFDIRPPRLGRRETPARRPIVTCRRPAGDLYLSRSLSTNETSDASPNLRLPLGSRRFCAILRASRVAATLRSSAGEAWQCVISRGHTQVSAYA